MFVASVEGADVILDPVGAPYWSKHSQCVAMDGRILHIGFVSGSCSQLGLSLIVPSPSTSSFDTSL